MKKFVTLALAALMTLSLVSCAPKPTDSLADKKTFTVGFDAEFPPYGYKDESGEYVGFDLSLAEEVAKRNGWELKKAPLSWDSKDMELSAGNIDCIWNGFTMNGREDEYTWSEPYVDNSQVFVVPVDAGIADWAGLADKIVAVQADSSALKALQDEENQENLDLAASFKELSQCADYNTAFMDLDAGAVNAIAMDIGVANYQISGRGADKYVILEKTLASEQYAIGFLKGNTALRDQVQKTLDQMVEDGTADTIVETWAAKGLAAASVTLGK